jgi:hypothetical protein
MLILYCGTISTHPRHAAIEHLQKFGAASILILAGGASPHERARRRFQVSALSGDSIYRHDHPGQRQIGLVLSTGLLLPSFSLGVRHG